MQEISAKMSNLLKRTPEGTKKTLDCNTKHALGIRVSGPISVGPVNHSITWIFAINPGPQSVSTAEKREPSTLV